MAKATDIIKRWKKKKETKPQEDLKDVLKVLEYYEFKIREGGKHEIIVFHEKLKDLDYGSMGIGNELTIPLVKGRTVRKHYIIKLMKYIEILEEFYGY